MRRSVVVLPAAGRTEKRHKGTGWNGEREIVDRGHRAIPLAHRAKLDGRMGCADSVHAIILQCGSVMNHAFPGSVYAAPAGTV